MLILRNFIQKMRNIIYRIYLFSITVIFPFLPLLENAQSVILPFTAIGVL